jgi:hypothetical protein
MAANAPVGFYNLTRGQLRTAPGSSRRWWAVARPELRGACTIGGGPVIRAARHGPVDTHLLVAIGVMAGRLQLRRHNLFRGEAGLLQRALATWVPQTASWARLLIMRECARRGETQPWLGAPIVWRCFSPKVGEGRVSHGANFAKLADLLRALLHSLPGRDFYLKIDVRASCKASRSLPDATQ